MVYATYEYYEKQYYGTLIPEKAFEQAIHKASQFIDYFTFGRITEEDTTMYPYISACACAMADVIYKKTGEGNQAREVKSENTDGYSVSYVTECMDGMISEDVMKRKLYSIAEIYLMHTGLLYLGC